MEIDGKKRREIREALMEAFPLPNNLRLVTDDVLDVPLQNVTSLNNDMATMVFDLITWVRARGRLTELVIGAAAANPGAPKLKAVADQFRFAAAAPGEVERIVLADVPFENVGQWLDTLGRLRRAVCRIEPQPPPNVAGYGTGFLVAPDVVMTNYHVIEPLLNGGADRVVARFDYETAADGVAVSKGREARLAADWRLGIESPVAGLDFALVRLAEPVGGEPVAGGKRELLRPTRHAFQVGRPLIILQHPAAAPLKLAIGSVVDPDPVPNRVSYTVNTEPGSSGSPCFTTRLDLVALHHWGDNPNRGVRMGAVLDFLAARKADLAAKGLGGLVG
jgi:V8-like Glu-specific endopeptidase